MQTHVYPSVLTIAGFDGSGGAGIQADIKTISALGCYATSVLTALPVQNTTGVKSTYSIPCEAVQEQLEAILEDIPPKAIKIGMVHTEALVDTIVHFLKAYPDIPVVFDPVMVATSGDTLIEDKTIHAIIGTLFPVVSVLTPNMDEAAVLTGITVKTLEDMYTAGNALIAMGCSSVLVKGGHLNTPTLTSLYFDANQKGIPFNFDKIDTNNTHGSGCTLSSAIASYLAQGYPLSEAVAKGQVYVHEAITHGRDVITGKGHGPLNHFFDPQKLIKHEVV